MFIITKHQLATALFCKVSEASPLRVGDVTFVSVLNVGKEDGSGRCFNVHGYVLAAGGATILHTVFVRTVD